nr:putative mating-type 1-2-7 protein [Ceratocystis cacaofunesta]WRK64993.1 putative mating-type 1-2-7 protein [Ceratocystis platani]
MSAFTQDIGQDPWSEFSRYPVWRSRAWPNARVLFCLYYRQMFDQRGKLNPNAIRYTQQLWLATKERRKWEMLEELVKVIHLIQIKKGVPRVHPCVILYSGCQIMRVVPPSNYLRSCSLEPDPVNINLPILFKRVALGSSFMGITGRYIFRYFLTVYFTRMLGVSPFTGDGVMAFIDKIVMLRSRAAQNYFFQLGDQVFWD